MTRKQALATVKSKSPTVYTEAARKYARKSKADNTIRMYRSAWAEFQRFAEARGVPSLPASPATVIDFITALADGGLKPSLTLLLDLPVEAGLARRRKSGGDWNRLDALELEFHQRVRQGYLELSREKPGRWTRIDAEREEEEVWTALRKAVSARLEAGG